MQLTAEKRSHIDSVHTLCLAHSNQMSVEGVSHEELKAMIIVYHCVYEKKKVDQESEYCD